MKHMKKLLSLLLVLCLVLSLSCTAFAVDEAKPLDGKTVILVDDLVTTGATSAACVRLLRDAGCLSVYAAAVAYTPLKPGAFSDE